MNWGERVAGQKPRQGWIYFINPYKVSLRCKLGHHHIYEINEPGEIECKKLSCTQVINSSRVFRGEHPYIVWTNDQFQDESTYIQTAKIGAVVVRWERFHFNPYPTQQEFEALAEVVGVEVERLWEMLPPMGEGMKCEPIRVCGACYASRLVIGLSGSLSLFGSAIAISLSF